VSRERAGAPPVRSFLPDLLESRAQAFLFLLLASFLIFARLGQGYLANFDDCYYAEKAKEMIRGRRTSAA
jgi:hypothetical protein